MLLLKTNLSETAFLRKRDGYYDLKWFTPETEIDLCGHATLASAFVLMNTIEQDLETISFETLSGRLTVRREGELYIMDFPSRPPSPCPKPDALEAALGVHVLETHRSRDLLALVDSEDTVRTLRPDFGRLSEIGGSFAVIVTAEGANCDFVSRFFAPNAGIPEDPVTGSSHTTAHPLLEPTSRQNRTAGPSAVKARRRAVLPRPRRARRDRRQGGLVPGRRHKNITQVFAGTRTSGPFSPLVRKSYEPIIY